jgi:hypothetical protein
MSRRTRASAAKVTTPPEPPPAPAPAPSPTPEEQAQPPARPRRRREQSEASAFLSKTYAMISALDGVVGGWSKNGDTMVIFDSEKFASEVIPQYFKHNNFRSFVRQLNFYGFRKLRADANAGPAAAARWEFKHPNFRRGRHDLLVLIRRAEHYDHGGPDAAAQRARQAELEREVSDLRSKVMTLTETLDKVVGVLASQGLSIEDDRPLKRPRYDRQDSEQMFLERLPSSVRGVAPLDFAPHSLDGSAISPRLADARGLEGQPLRRFGADPVPGPAPAESTPAQQARRLEGRPLAPMASGDLALTSFEGSRLESLIRTLSEERAPA